MDQIDILKRAVLYEASAFMAKEYKTYLLDEILRFFSEVRPLFRFELKIVSSDVDIRTTEEIDHWLNENFILFFMSCRESTGSGKNGYIYTYHFAKEEDVVATKLKWC